MDCIYVEHPEEANPGKQKADWWLPGAEGKGKPGVAANERGASFLIGENGLKLAWRWPHDL